ncbi:MAG: PQQ-binding-like beta-propeller repeat protein [Alphaproteobacteria bacterium]|nr:PQQ-binding-like beta-propeller repeat protein [Alphaproteobacteria bacterium]
MTVGARALPGLVAGAVVLAVPAWAGADGWRHGGTATYPDATPPPSLDVSAAAWSATLPAWGNASPVLFGDMVCTTSEPATVTCLDQATGAVRWTATNHRIDAVPPDQRAKEQARIDAAPQVEARIQEGLREMSALRRDARRPDAPADLPERLAKLSAELDAAKAELDELTTYLMPADLGMIGYASATPATDGTTLYVTTGNGVVSAFDRAGARRWSVWLGTDVKPMKGFDYGSVTSPQLHGDLLLVGHRHLVGLDAKTGAVRWQDPALWDHYGTPPIVDVGGLAVVLTPDGRIVRLSDGRQLAENLARIYYIAPVVDGDLAMWIGGRGVKGDAGSNRATAWRLARQGDTVTTTKVYDVPLPVLERVYTVPLVLGHRAYFVSLDNQLVVLDTATGARKGALALDAPVAEAGRKMAPVAYAQPTAVGDHIVLGWQSGVLATITPGDTPRLEALAVLPEPSRATPTYDGARVYIRSLEHVYRLGR